MRKFNEFSFTSMSRNERERDAERESKQTKSQASSKYNKLKKKKPAHVRSKKKHKNEKKDGKKSSYNYWEKWNKTRLNIAPENQFSKWTNCCSSSSSSCCRSTEKQVESLEGGGREIDASSSLFEAHEMRRKSMIRLGSVSITRTRRRRGTRRSRRRRHDDSNNNNNDSYDMLLQHARSCKARQVAWLPPCHAACCWKHLQ